MKQLVSIDSITLIPAVDALDAERPDPTVPSPRAANVKMVMKYSVYLYDNTAP